ncbi:MAG: hypothetical protein ABSB29_06165 [Nitrososphaerales archaeon]
MKKKVGEHLKTAMNITDFDVTFAKRTKEFALGQTAREIWKVNVEFKEGNFDVTALVSLDAVNGEVLEFQKGKYWKF